MRFLTTLTIAVVLTAASGCASASTRHKLTVGSSGLYAAIATIDDTERTLSTSGAITKAQHDTLAPDILLLLKAGKAANDVILVVGAPVPQPMQDVVTKLAAIATRVTGLFPDGAAKSKIQTAIIGAQTAATLLLAFLPQSTIGAHYAVQPELHPRLGPSRSAARTDRAHRILRFASRDGREGRRSGYRAVAESGGPLRRADRAA